MSDQNYTLQEFKDRGFRCLQPIEVVFLDGSRATIRANSYRSSFERADDTPRQRAALRLYSVQRSGHAAVEILSELELEQKIGSEQLQRLD